MKSDNHTSPNEIITSFNIVKIYSKSYQFTLYVLVYLKFKSKLTITPAKIL